MSSHLDDTRTAYDTIAETYADCHRDALARRRVDRPGLEIHAQLLREPLLPTERGQLLYLFARKPSPTPDN
jgi:hypothetical protein